ncbi:TrmB family transcriptional regulator [Candidatus Bathyarchaeota archaeon]|nr:TrmB family transcriptional regulator [Candidatus Bathyarchaeota archaeon]
MLSVWPKIVEYIGLSEYESKVYLSLINLGTAGARKLSLNCDVPRTKVYGTLKKLIDYGLVVEIPGSPKQFAPSHPGESFNTILNITKEKAVDFDAIVKQLENIHEKHKEDTGPKKKLVWFLDEEHDIKGKCNEIIRQSEEELTIVTTDDGLEILFNAAHRLLDEMLENGVAIKLYSPLDPRVNPLARELSYIYQVKKVEVNTPILFINSDNKRFILAKLEPRGAENPFEAAMFTEDMELLDLICLLLVNGHKEILLKALQL